MQSFPKYNLHQLSYTCHTRFSHTYALQVLTHMTLFDDFHSDPCMKLDSPIKVQAYSCLTEAPCLTSISKHKCLTFASCVSTLAVQWALFLAGVGTKQFPCYQPLVKRTELKLGLASQHLVWHHTANFLSHIECTKFGDCGKLSFTKLFFRTIKNLEMAFKDVIENVHY